MVLASAVASLTAVPTGGWAIAASPTFAALNPIAPRATLAPSRINLLVQRGRERPDFFDQGDRQLEQEINQLQKRRSSSSDPLLTIDPSTEQRWQPLLLKQAGISVWLPTGDLRTDVETLETALGPLRFQFTTSDTGEAQFGVAYVEQVSATQAKTPDALYAAVRDAIGRQTAGHQVKNDRAVLLDGNSGREITIQKEDEIMTFRLVLVGQRLYLLAMAHKLNSAVPAATATTFFDSFYLIK